MPALVGCTQALGEPRYPTLKGIMGARSKEIATRSLADLGVELPGPAPDGWATRVVEARPPAPRGSTRIVRGSPQESAREIVAFLAERRFV